MPGALTWLLESLEVTVTSRLHRQKDKERQSKTEENVDRRPVVALGAGDEDLIFFEIRYH